MWEIKPILKVLWKNRMSAALVVLQVALTLAVISNALFVISERKNLVGRETGVALSESFSVQFHPADPNVSLKSTIESDLAAIRNLPYVEYASVFNHVPLSGSGRSAGVANEEMNLGGQYIGANIIEMDAMGIDALGSRIIEGRSFSINDVQFYNPMLERNPAKVTLLTEQLAKELFPNGSAVGQTIYEKSDEPLEVIGIVAENIGNWVHWGSAGSVMFWPNVSQMFSRHYVVRTQKGKRAEVMAQIEQVLLDLEANRVIQTPMGLDEFKKLAYFEDTAMIKILTLLSAILTLVTLMGIVGLTIFWVNKRTKEIGTRRALGATKTQISRYFLLENFVLTCIGVLSGAYLAVMFNGYLVTYHNLQTLEWRFPLAVGISLVLLGLLATLWPSLKAAKTSPAIATRST